MIQWTDLGPFFQGVWGGQEWGKKNGGMFGGRWCELGVRGGEIVSCVLWMGYSNTYGIGFEFTLVDKPQITQCTRIRILNTIIMENEYNRSKELFCRDRKIWRRNGEVWG